MKRSNLGKELFEFALAMNRTMAEVIDMSEGKDRKEQREYLVTWNEPKEERILATSEEEATELIKKRREMNIWAKGQTRDWKAVEVPYMDDDHARQKAEEDFDEWLTEGKYDHA